MDGAELTEAERCDDLAWLFDELCDEFVYMRHASRDRSHVHGISARDAAAARAANLEPPAS